MKRWQIGSIGVVLGIGLCTGGCRKDSAGTGESDAQKLRIEAQARHTQEQVKQNAEQAAQRVRTGVDRH